ncbi:MAG TPA: hypothetical protein VHW70_06550 [Edaphobacter sp.]|nr:hypothetical protein [Edaphobacter sp.]
MDIVVYSLFLPSSLFGVVREESVVVREKQKNDCFQSRAAGEGRDEILSSQGADKDRIGLDGQIRLSRSGLRTKPMGWVLQGRLW